MKGKSQTTLLAIALVIVCLLAVPLWLPSGASAVQATQLYTNAQMWLLVLICVGLIFVVKLIGDVATALEAMNRSLEQLRKQLVTSKEDAANEKTDS
jgi:hypothetical protein